MINIVCYILYYISHSLQDNFIWLMDCFLFWNSSTITFTSVRTSDVSLKQVPIRPNNMTRMKQIFTQEIFTEQVVTSHAVKVPVTVNLNANIPGFLPVHCIHQLLKSRAFTKHRVPIKDWIYR